MEEKCLDKRQTNPQTQARQPNKQMVKCAGRRSLPKLQRQLMQQRQQCRLKDDIVRDIPSRICKKSVKFRKLFFLNCPRIVHFLSNMQNVAISRCCFSVTFCKQRRRNEEIVITHALHSHCIRCYCC